MFGITWGQSYTLVQLVWGCDPHMYPLLVESTINFTMQTMGLETQAHRRLGSRASAGQSPRSWVPPPHWCRERGKLRKKINQSNYLRTTFQFHANIPERHKRNFVGSGQMKQNNSFKNKAWRHYSSNLLSPQAFLQLKHKPLITPSVPVKL